MTLVIHKQPLPIFEGGNNHIILKVPGHVQCLKVARQYPHDPTPYIWYLCDPTAPMRGLPIHVVGTGHPFEPIGEAGYIGTEFFHDGQLVFHFFQEKW